jgi:glycosyltransferase involved in cell wall biosynthesis
MRYENLDVEYGHTLQNLAPVSVPFLTKKLRILHVLFASEIAGSERYCIDLANAQAALGHDVHLVSSSRVDIRKHLHREVVLHAFSTRLFRRWRLRKLITAERIEIAHAHLSPGCKALVTVQGSVTKIATLHVGYKPKQHARLDGIICVNEAQLLRIGDYAGCVSRIPNWLPEVKQTERFDLRIKLGLPPAARLIGTVGRLHPSKGNDVLISAFLRAAPDNTALVIAGVGPQRAVLEKLVAGDERIRMIGYCDNVTGFLRNLDLFVSPSREESAGLAILEAMNEGVPIIASATEGPSEYLREHQVRFVEPGSVEALAAALSDALRSDDTSRPWRIDYDMVPFSRATGVDNVLRFYGEVEECRSGFVK